MCIMYIKQLLKIRGKYSFFYKGLIDMYKEYFVLHIHISKDTSSSTQKFI